MLCCWEEEVGVWKLGGGRLLKEKQARRSSSSSFPLLCQPRIEEEQHNNNTANYLSANPRPVPLFPSCYSVGQLLFLMSVSLSVSQFSPSHPSFPLIVFHQLPSFPPSSQPLSRFSAHYFANLRLYDVLFVSYFSLHLPLSFPVQLHAPNCTVSIISASFVGLHESLPNHASRAQFLQLVIKLIFTIHSRLSC